MCGIVGYIGHRECAGILLNGLERLEYRGYDSAGLAVSTGAETQVARSVGKLVNLERTSDKTLQGQIGIGHTRWATHGKPSEENAHHTAGPVGPMGSWRITCSRSPGSARSRVQQ